MHIIILKKESDFFFPTSKRLQCKFQFKCAASCVDRGAYGTYALTKLKDKVPACPTRACGVKYPSACVKNPRRKIRMDFSPISGELTDKQVDKGRFVNLQVNEIKRKENKAQMREELIPSPQWSHQSICTQFVTR
jgi:hypothetical protein